MAVVRPEGVSAVVASVLSDQHGLTFTWIYLKRLRKDIIDAWS